MISVILERQNLDVIRAEIVKTVKKALSAESLDGAAKEELLLLLEAEAQLKQIFDKAYEAAKLEAEPTFTRYTGEKE